MKKSGRATSITKRAGSARTGRRAFLKVLAGATGAAGIATAAAYFGFTHRSQNVGGQLLGPSAHLGHRLRQPSAGHSSGPVETIETVIVGGGIAGLSAAWWLHRNGYREFVLLEIEPHVGGNAAYGRNAVSAYPWGAHYLPLPGRDAQLVHRLLEEIGVIKGRDAAARPIYDELHVCADPQERLYLQGRWQEGVLPQMALTESDQRQYDDFFRTMERYKKMRGRDGRRAFTIPLDLSSRDPELQALDRISMAEFMARRGWNSKYLRWYVNYGCRDDYGLGFDKVSAWAGIHYFAARDAVAANVDGGSLLTWPEGNGWLVERLRERVAPHIRTDAMVLAIENGTGEASLEYEAVTARRTTRVRARHVILAAPRFVAAHVIRGLDANRYGVPAGLAYTPWLVANITLNRLPAGAGAPLSWDNVSYHSDSLGYIVATHQALRAFPKQTVITYYRPLDAIAEREARSVALANQHADWVPGIAADLERMHRGITEDIAAVDIWIWGHGMSGPRVGFLWGEARRRIQQSFGRVHFAHSDMSGISIFEEAQYRGVQAADQVLRAVGRKAKAV